jgi:SSS family solute:Na+ symporter
MTRRSFGRDAAGLAGALAGAMHARPGAIAAAAAGRLAWSPLPPLPDPIGVAGPFVGSHAGAVIVAGGANFAPADSPDLWTLPKRWHADVHVLTGSPAAAEWIAAGPLPHAIAYGGAVTTPAGVACLGGDDGSRVFADAFLLVWDPAARRLATRSLPAVPAARTAVGAALVGDAIVCVGGQAGLGLDSAVDDCFRLAVGGGAWERLPPMPGGPRSMPIVVSQTVAGEERLFVFGGRRQRPGTSGAAGIEPLADAAEFSPRRHAADPATGWRRLRPAAAALMAGAAMPLRDGMIAILAGDDGARIPLEAADPESVRTHPGFPKKARGYDPATDAWLDLGPIPANQVTTPAAAWAGGVVIASGEIRPRVRTRDVWHVVERSPG